MRYLLAFDKFKDCMSAGRACSVAAEAILRVDPAAVMDFAPLTDGGEGFCTILTNAVGGRMEKATVTGPRGEKCEASLGFVSGGSLPDAVVSTLRGAAQDKEIAVIEMAEASGLWRVPVALRDPWLATSRGVGELIALAAQRGVAAIILGVGGSATCDLGLGALEALGFECVTAPKAAQGILPADWGALVEFRGRAMSVPPIFVACDVVNPLLGNEGAAAVFGPQKGLRAVDVPKMDAEMGRVGRAFLEYFGQNAQRMKEPCSGAAGGIGFGLRVACGAAYTPGFELVWRWLDLERRVRAADVVLTGEGSFDASSLSGKGPGEIVRRALLAGRRAAVFAGRVEGVAASDFSDAGARLALSPIAPKEMTTADSILMGESLLSQAAQAFALGR